MIVVDADVLGRDRTGEETYVLNLLRELPGVISARGRGLMVAAEIGGAAPEIARRALLEQRLIINATGPTTLRFLPPLVVSAAEIDDALSRLPALLS